MTLKRKIFISNILMIAVPLLLFWVVICGAMIAKFGMRGMSFDLSAAEKQQMFEDWHDGISFIWDILAITIMVAVNQILTRSIIKRVTKPLDTLISGARQSAKTTLAFALTTAKTPLQTPPLFPPV